MKKLMHLFFGSFKNFFVSTGLTGIVIIGAYEINALLGRCLVILVLLGIIFIALFYIINIIKKRKQNKDINEAIEKFVDWYNGHPEPDNKRYWVKTEPMTPHQMLEEISAQSPKGKWILAKIIRNKGKKLNDVFLPCPETVTKCCY